MKNLFYKKAIFLLIAITGGVILSTLSYFVSEGSKTPIPQVHADVPAGSSSSSSSSSGDCDTGGSGGSGGC